MARLSKKKALEQANSQNKVCRTAIYTRLSVVDNNKKDNEDSIENQVNIVKDYMSDKEEFKLEKIYTDNGCSGTNFDRPAFKEMFEDIQNHKIDCIIVKDLSRLGRDYIQTGEYIQEIFPFYNVRFIAINNDIDTNNLNSLSNIILNFTNFSNNVYALDIAKKSSQALRTLQEKGSFIGSNPPYGYNKIRDEKTRVVSFVIDEEVADNVRLIFQLKLDGLSYSKIAKYLEENDIPSPYQYLCKKGKLKNENDKTYYWYHYTIKNLLKNEAYIGNMVQGMKKSNRIEGVLQKPTPKEDWVRVEDTHEPIVSKELFYEVQGVINDITDNYHSNLKYTHIEKIEDIYKGKLKCECGGNLYLKRTIKQENKSTYTIYSYKCPRPYMSKNQKQCQVCSISIKYLNCIVLKSIQEQIEKFADLENLMKNKKYTNEFQIKLDTLSKVIDKKSNELSKIIKIKASLYDDLTENLLNENEYVYAKKKYQDKEKELNSMLLELKEEKAFLDSQNSSNNKYLISLMSFKTENTLTKEIIDILIDKIKIHSREDIEIIYNFHHSPPISKEGIK